MKWARSLHSSKGMNWTIKMTLLLTMGLSLAAHGKTTGQARYGAHPGYVTDVQKEKHTIDVEVVLIEEPSEVERQREIFDAKLTKEFRQQFKYKFGATEMEQSLNSPGRFDDYYYYTGRTVSLKEYQAEQRSFGEYMGRRLVEHHVDRWAKANPKLQPVYELKDKMTNLKVEVQKGYKVDLRYSLSGNHLDFILDNPYDWDSRLRIEGGGQETIISIGGPVSKRWSVSGLTRFNDGIVQIIGTRRVTPALSLSITGSTDSKEEGQLEKQDLFLVGVSYTN